jgi:hypothetical protein
MAIDLLFCAAAWGQVEGIRSAIPSPDTVEALKAEPSSTYLSIQGPIPVFGVGPVPLSVLSPGKYRLTAGGPGLATSRWRFTRDQTGLTFRSWAGPSAMLKPPGLVHLVRGERRGWYHLGAGAFSGAMWWRSAGTVKDAQDRVSRAMAELTQASAADAIAAASRELSDAQDEERDQRRIRGIWAGYFAASWLGAGVETWLLTPKPTVRSDTLGEYTAMFPRAGRRSAALRSALVPGAGQRYLGRSTRAAIFSSAIGASVAGAVLAQEAVLGARRDFYAAQRRRDEAQNDDERRTAQGAIDDAKSRTDTRALIRSILVGTSASFYLWSVVDAFVSGNLAEASAQAVAWSVAPTPNGVHLTMSWHLP